MADFRRQTIRALGFGAGLAVLGGCGSGFDFDLRAPGSGGTSAAVLQETASRPDPDDRGIISYPNYQVAVARRGDRIADVAERVGLPASELARYNGIPEDVRLRRGEVIALPRRVAEPSPATGATVTGPIRPAESIDVAVLADEALDRAERDRPATAAPAPAAAPQPQAGAEPIRHRVVRGETAYSISRLYDVSVRSLADWNGLGPDLSVREGQYLLIPVAAEPTVATAPTRRPATPPPGTGSPTPVPPSASRPLPEEDQSAAAPARPAPPSPNLGAERSQAARLLMPVQGGIIREYEKGKNDGIDISAAAGAPVRAADAGTVAAITRDTDQVPILVLRHGGELLTVYANIADIKVSKGDRIKRGQTIATVRAGSPSFVHFEVREGFESVDPVKYVN